MKVKSNDQWNPTWGPDVSDIDVKYYNKANGKLTVSADYTDFYITYQDLRLEKRHMEITCLSTMPLAPVFLVSRTQRKVGNPQKRAMKLTGWQAFYPGRELPKTKGDPAKPLSLV